MTRAIEPLKAPGPRAYACARPCTRACASTDRDAAAVCLFGRSRGRRAGAPELETRGWIRHGDRGRRDLVVGVANRKDFPRVVEPVNRAGPEGEPEDRRVGDGSVVLDEVARLGVDLEQAVAAPVAVHREEGAAVD